MVNLDNYKTIPIGSLLTVEESISDHYLEKLANLPKGLVTLVLSSTTGAFLKGVARTNNFEVSLVPSLAFAVLRVAMGDVALAQLGSVISSELKMANDKAQRIAQEIEKELFAPVMLELNQFLSRQKQQPKMPIAQAPNVINLKNQSPTQRPTPPKPMSPTLPPRLG